MNVARHIRALAPAAAVAIALAATSSTASADAQPRPGTADLAQPLAPVAAAQTQRVFLNFDGGTLRHGDDEDATKGVTQSADLAGAVLGFGGDVSGREAIVQAVRADFAAYNIAITDQRPMAGDYSMTVVGPNRPSQEFYAQMLGTAFIDCWNAQVHNDVSFAFHEADDGTSPAIVARTISHEIGHGLGLEHTAHEDAIMFGSNAGTDAAFLDECVEVIPARGLGIICGSQHETSCGAPNLQNAHLELLHTLGPAAVDLQAPQTNVMSPQDGAEFDEGEAITITAFANDDAAVDQVRFYENGELVATDDAAPFEWTTTQAPFGSVEYDVVAVDLSGNEASASVLVFVGIEQTPRFTNAQRDAGGCSIGARPTSCGALALLVLVLGLRRRRAPDVRL